jgi:ParB-like chromosome segregation protein Spo0J
MIIETVSAKSLKPAEWQANYLLAPDRRQLQRSLDEFGWLYPLVVRTDGVIIDGHQRWALAMHDKALVARDDMNVPVHYVDADEIDSMVLHVRLNQGRGQIVAKRYSQIIRRILRSGKFDDESLRTVLGLSVDEYDLLSDGSLIKSRKIKVHEFSKAWVPVEAPPATAPTTISIERPTTADA